MSNKSIEKLSDVKTQSINANRHTERGLDLLGASIEQDGWIGAITTAADGETFDGSARVEKGTAAGFEDAIVVESDGTRPVIVKRTDIPSADDPKAIRLGIAANRIPQVNLAWDANVLQSIEEIGLELSALGFNDAERDELLADALANKGNAFTPNLTPGSNGDFVSAADLEKAKADLRAQINREIELRPLNCPHCGGQFFLSKDALPT